jgi:predicted permease
MERIAKDFRYAVRKLIRSPGFTAAAVLSLGLGIGANTAIYSLLDAALLNPLPVREPDRLVAAYTSGGSGTVHSNPSFLDYQDYAEADVFEALAAYSDTELSLAVRGTSQRISGALVTGNYFGVLGIGPRFGRLIRPADDRGGDAAPVAVLDYDFWKGRFGGDPAVVGSTIALNGAPFTVIGVAPEKFRGVRLDSDPDVYIPMQVLPRVATGFMARFNVLSLRDVRWLNTVGRLADGVSLEEARRALDVVAARLEEAYPESNTGRRASLEPATTAAALSGRGELVRFVALLGGVVAFTLLIACANVANLLLTRARHRRREVAVRLAIGAGRGQLLRQLLTESTVLGLVGGAAGLGVAILAFDLLATFRLPGEIDIGSLGLGLNPHILLFTLLVSVMVGLLFGSIPALQASRPDLVPALKDQTSGSGSRGSRLQAALVSAQVAVCLVLLIGAGLFIRGLMNALETDLGFRPAGAVAVSVNLGPQGYELEQARSFYSELLERTRGLSGVSAAALAMVVPVNPGGMRTTVLPQGYEPAADEDMEIDVNLVSPGYFRTLGIPLLSGRGFEASDRSDAPRVAVVNETWVDRFWPGQEPVGRTIRFGPDEDPVPVVGVVAEGRYRSLDEEPRPYIYLPLDQGFDVAGMRTLNLVARAADDLPAASLAPAIRREVHSLDPQVPVFAVRTVETQVRELLLPQRMGMTLLALLGFVALTLASLGIYGIVAYSVTQRTAEIGLRAALGARPSQVVRMVVRGSMVPVLLGLAIGLWAAGLLSETAASFLYGISPTDPLTFATVAALLLLVGLAASYLPARRAAAVDPARVLRHE